MKSKESLFKEIMAVSIHKVKQRSVAGARDEFEQRMKTLPTKIHELNADPYMFIFDSLIEFPEQVDFTLTQYQTMIEQSFLNPNKNSAMLTRHFRKNIDNHSFRIIQTLMDIKDPNLEFFTLFFEIHNSVAMPENVLENFRFTGYKWLARAFNFRQYPRPPYIDQLTSGILKSENRNLPTLQDQHRSRQRYIMKLLNHMTLTIQNNLKPQNDRVQSKYGFCFMCLNPAQYYCKDTKIPVCSPMCKKAHLNYTTNNPTIDFQYNQKFREQIEKLLITNLKNKKNVALSIDYLCAIYMNSQHVPKEPLPHRELLNSPVIVERIWVLYTMYYYRSNEVFQHIFADGLKNKIDYICINSAKYFLMIVDTQRIFEIYQYLDCYGYRRILPTIINNLHDEQNKIKFIYSLINRVFEHESLKSVGKLVHQLQAESSLLSTLLRAINYDKNPLEKFKEVFGEDAMRQMCRFIIKNEDQINKAKICQIILPKLKPDKNSDKKEEKGTKDSANKPEYVLCHTFLQQLLLQIGGNELQIKGSPFIDEIVRQVFYFLNTKISDSIYSLLQILYNVLDLSRTKYRRYRSWSNVSIEHIFSPENTSSKDTIFQFAYYIIMIVTELHQYNLSGSAKKDKKLISLQQFLDRFKHFDAKFVNNMRSYMADVYQRLVEFPFSVEARGVLCGYRTVRKVDRKGVTFHVVRVLLDNWQLIYESMSKIKNDANILYRICKCLINFPTICQPFLQLLLSKTTTQPNSNPNPNPKQQQALLLYINNILQQQPNCIGTASWKYLFMRNPSPVNSGNKFMFQIGTLIHYSKALSFGNFIWFVREFCRNVRLAQNYHQCVSLLSYNLRLSTNSPCFPQQKQRISILNKQYLDLFQKQTSVYHKIQLIKDSFRLKNLQFAIKLLDIIEINVVSQRLIVLGIVDVLEEVWRDVQAYVEKGKGKGKEELLGGSQEHGRTTVVPNTIWQHILQKVLTICLNAPDFLPHISTFLLSQPPLHPYFQLLNIQHAIESAGSGRHFHLANTLTKQLHKFQQHIPQMYNAKFCLMQRGDGDGQGLLEQFVWKENVDCFARHFQYFWEIQGVYGVFVDTMVQGIGGLEEVEVEGEGQGQRQVGKKKKKEKGLCRFDYDGLLKVLQQNDYINLIKLQNRLQPIISFIVAVTVILQPLSTNNTAIGNTYQNYMKQVQTILQQLLFQKLSILHTLSKPSSQPPQQQQSTKITFPYFMHIYNLTYAYLTPLFRLSTLIDGDVVGDCRYGVDRLVGMLETVNGDYGRRGYLYRLYVDAYGYASQGGFKLAPGLLEQEYMAAVINITCPPPLPKDKSKQTNRNTCNWQALLSYLNQTIQTYKKLQPHLTQPPKPPKPQQPPTEPTLLSQQIRYYKKTLQQITKKLQNQPQITISQESRVTVGKINMVLVELLELGFDFYDPVAQRFQFMTAGEKFNYVYRIYGGINRQQGV